MKDILNNYKGFLKEADITKVYIFNAKKRVEFKGESWEELKIEVDKIKAEKCGFNIFFGELPDEIDNGIILQKVLDKLDVETIKIKPSKIANS